MKRTVPVAVTLLLSLAGCATPTAPAPATQPPTTTPSVAPTPAQTPSTPPSTPAPVEPTPATTPATAGTPATRPSPPAKPSRTPAQKVVLGGDLKGTADKGMGTVKPSYIDFGGHPTTILRKVKWTSWGGDVATATAEAMWIPPGKATVDAQWEKASVRAEKIGTCNGKRAYTRLVWTFPGKKGEQPVPFDACTGISII